jgi:hypothetical protein
MKKGFMFLSVLAILSGGCTPLEPEPELTMTIRNESSFNLSKVTWSGIQFGSLSKGDVSTKETTKNAYGFIFLTLTRKDIAIELRTPHILKAVDVTIFNDTPVVEVRGDKENPKRLGEIGFVPVITIVKDNKEIKQDGTVDMGPIALNKPGEVTVTVGNTGDKDLTIGEITKTGKGEEVFSFDLLSSGNIPVNDTSRFTIRCTPEVAMEYRVTIKIPNNDPSRNPAVFSVLATGEREYPDIELKQGKEVVAHDTTFEFGSVQANQSKKLTFSLKNTGRIDLSLDPATSSSPKFVVTDPSKTTVSPGETTSFEIEYTPTNAESNKAKITIPNNSATNPFEFTVSVTVGKGEVTLIFPDEAAEALDDTPITISRTSIGGQKHTFSVNGTYSAYQWWVDGIMRETGSSLDLSASAYTIGVHRVTLEVTTANNLVYSKQLTFRVEK